MCLTLSCMESYFTKATPRSAKFWRCFCVAYIGLLAAFFTKFVYWMMFMVQFEKPEENFIDYPPYYGDAETFLLDLPDSWNSKQFITGVSLTRQGEECANPAFARFWPGTSDYQA